MFDDLDAPDVPAVRATLRLRGDTLDPDFLTQQLGVAPTLVAQQGDRTARGRVRDSGVWLYRLDAPPGTELGEAISMLLAPFPDDSTLWEELTSTYQADVRCELFLGGRVEGTIIDAEVLRELGRLGLPLALDFHASRDGDDSDD
jgi:hypothetical protein